MKFMKEYQILIGLLCIAFAILIVGHMISEALTYSRGTFTM